jgi:hypothetical protein
MIDRYTELISTEAQVDLAAYGSHWVDLMSSSVNTQSYFAKALVFSSLLSENYFHVTPFNWGFSPT